MNVFNGLFQQRKALRRSELQVYYDGISCILGKFFKRIRRNIMESDLNLVLQNSKYLKLEYHRMVIRYCRAFDKKIAALSTEKAEKLARLIVQVILEQRLNGNLALNAKFKILFRHVQLLKVWREFRG